MASLFELAIFLECSFLFIGKSAESVLIFWHGRNVCAERACGFF